MTRSAPALLLVTVLAAVVVSLVKTEGEMSAVTLQVAWLIAGLILLWVFMLSAPADRLLCRTISKVLRATTLLGQRRYNRLLQLGDGYSVCEFCHNGFFLTKKGTKKHKRH